MFERWILGGGSQVKATLIHQVVDAVERFFDDVAAAGIGFMNEAKAGVVELTGSYRVEWRPCGPSSRYWLQAIT